MHGTSAAPQRSAHHALGLPPEPPKSAWDRWNLPPSAWIGVPITCVEMLILIALSAFLPDLLLEHFSGSYPLSAISTGVADSIGGILAFILSPTFGRWADVYGRKKVILLMLGLGFLPITFLSLYPYLNLWFYISVRGAGKMTAFGILFSCVADIVPAADRAKLFGQTSGLGFLSIVVGPLLSLVLWNTATFRVCFALAVVILLYTVFLMPETLWIGLRRMYGDPSGAGGGQGGDLDAALLSAEARAADSSAFGASFAGGVVTPRIVQVNSSSAADPASSLSADSGASTSVGSAAYPPVVVVLSSPVRSNPSSGGEGGSGGDEIDPDEIEDDAETPLFPPSVSFSVGPAGIVVPDILPSSSGPSAIAAAASMNPFTALKVAFTSPQLRTIALIILFSQLSQNGIIEVAMLYLKKHLHFDKTDNSLLLLCMGGWSVVVMMFILPAMLRRWDEKVVLATALVLDFCHQMLYIFLPDKRFFYFISFCQGFGFMAFPSANAILSGLVSDADQGSVLAMSAGIRSVTQGLAPIAFNGLLAYFTWDHAFAQFPEAPFLLSSACIAIALILTLRLPKTKRALDREEAVRRASEERMRSAYETPGSGLVPVRDGEGGGTSINDNDPRTAQF